MNNKLWLAILVALAPTANAASSNNDCYPYNGFYIGINGGAIFTKGDISTDSSATFANALNPANHLISAQKNDVNDTDGGGSIYFGYSQMLRCSHFFLAGEIFANCYNRTVVSNFHTSIAQLTDEALASLTTATATHLKNSEYGLDFRPGYFFNNRFALYGRVGVAFNNVTLTANHYFSFTDTTDLLTTTTALSQSKNKNVEGLRLGAGLEGCVCKNLVLTADYIYTHYNSVNLTGQSDITTAIGGEDPVVTPGGLVSQSSAHLNTQTVTVGIKYYFG